MLDILYYTVTVPLACLAVFVVQDGFIRLARCWSRKR